MYTGLGDDNPALAWYCNGSWLASLIPACTPPAVNINAPDTTNYGAALSAASQAAQQAMASSVLAADCASNPQNYTTVPGSCSYVAPCDSNSVSIGGTCVNYWLMLGAAGLLLLMEAKR